jgi:hypothetical protein
MMRAGVLFKKPFPKSVRYITECAAAIILLLPQAVGQTPVHIDTGAYRLARDPRLIANDDLTEGAVELRLTFHPNGEVREAVAIAGPAGLRKTAVQSARSWIFFAPSTLPADLKVTLYFGKAPASVGSMRTAKMLPKMPDPLPPPELNVRFLPELPVVSIEFEDTSSETERRVKETLTLRVGQVMTGDIAIQTLKQLRGVDDSLIAAYSEDAAGKKLRVVIGPRAKLVAAYPKWILKASVSR